MIPFVFTCADLDANTFLVKELHGREELCALYRFDLVLNAVRQDITPDQIINKSATVFLERKGKYYPYSGLVSHFSFVESTTDHTVYRATVQPRLWHCCLTRQSRVFLRKTIPEICKQVLDDAGLDRYYEFNINSGDYPQREYVVQYQESDYNFLLRLMQVNGIWFYFREPPLQADDLSSFTEERMILSDMPSSFKPIAENSSLKYRSRTDMVQIIDDVERESIYELQLQRNSIPKRVIVKSYNYRTPDITICCEKEIPGGDAGTIYEYGGDFKNVSEAQHYSTLMAHRCAIRRLEMTGKSTCAGLRAGLRFTVEEHPRKEMNQQYVVRSVTHTGLLRSDGKSVFVPTYNNEFNGFISDNARYYRPNITAIQTKMPDFMTARIEGSNSEYSTLDEQGRYKVRMPFDISETGKYQASKYIRMLQEYSGPGYGMHFPSHENAEIIISHINGNPDKPVGIRVVPDANTHTPVASSNKQESVIRTAGGNEIIMNDTDGRQKFALHSPFDMNLNAGNDITDSTTRDRTISVCGNEKKEIAADQTLSVGGRQGISIAGDKNISVDGDCLTDTTGDVSESVKGNKNVAIGGDEIVACKATRCLDVGGDLDEDSGGNRVIDIKGGSTVYSSGNNATDASNNAVVKANAMVTIMGNSVTIKGNFDLGVQAITSYIGLTSDCVVINSPVINIAAGMINVKADTQCNATGLIVMLN